jgi:hypothetical protein
VRLASLGMTTLQLSKYLKRSCLVLANSSVIVFVAVIKILTEDLLLLLSAYFEKHMLLHLYDCLE